VLTPDYLARLVRDSDARYFLISTGGGPGGGQNAATTLISSTCRSVTAVSGLYDCAGKAQALARG
jgi:hypothetical protein